MSSEIKRCFHDLIRRRVQYGAAIAACLGGFCLGCSLGWNSPSTELLKRTYNIPILQRNMIGAALPLGCALGVLVVPLFLDLIGRRKTMLALIPPLVAGWLLIIFAGPVVPFYIVGRLITGAFGGMCCVVIPMYCAEISEKEIRGSLGVFFQLFLDIGILYAYCAAYMGDLQLISITCGVTPIIFGICVFFVPESPLYYLMKGKPEEAKKSLQMFRGMNYEIADELKLYKRIVDVDSAEKWNIKLMWKKSLRKVLCVSYGLMAAQQLSGISAIVFYGIVIFKAADVEMNSLTQNAILGTVQVMACLMTDYLVDKLGRKILMIISELTMCVCLIILGCYFTVKSYFPYTSDIIGYLPLISCCLYILAYSSGAGPIPWLYSGEIFPTKIKGTASSSAAFLNWLLAFLVTVSYQSIVETFGNDVTAFFFAGICAISAVFIKMFMVETKIKTLCEIQEDYGIMDPVI